MRSNRKLNVHLYKVHTGDKSSALEDLIKLAESYPLDQRTRSVGNQDYRLETILPPERGRPFWLLDFCKMRYDGGPGKASPVSPVESFDLEDDEGFAEETGLLYDPKSHYVVIQYNHHGPRSGAISAYLSAFDPDQANDYEFRIQLNPSAQARLDTKKTFSKLEVKVAPAKLSREFKQANVSLSSALEHAQEKFGGDYVSITVGLEPRSNASLRIRQWLKAFKFLATEERDAVDTLVISGRDDVGAALDPVDLIAEKLEFAYSDIELDAGRRYVRNARWNALVRSYNGWKGNVI